MNRSARILVAVVAAQAALIGAWWGVEQSRSPHALVAPELSTAQPQLMAGHVRRLSIRTRDGGDFDLGTLSRPTLLHFWATWCPPCRAELPGLLALPDSHQVGVLAVALDKRWADIDRFFDGRVPAAVLLADAAEIERVFSIRTLPVTFLVKPGGELRLRFDGARDWTDRAFVDTWVAGSAEQ